MAKTKTPFGAWLEAEGIDYETARAKLDVTRAYVGMLARGEATPKLALAGLIWTWSKKKVTMDSWLPYCK